MDNEENENVGRDEAGEEKASESPEKSRARKIAEATGEGLLIVGGAAIEGVGIIYRIIRGDPNRPSPLGRLVDRVLFRSGDRES